MHPSGSSRTLDVVKLVPVLMAALPTALSVSPAVANPRWRIDLSARGIGSVEVAGSAPMSEPAERAGLVPAVGARVLRQLGPLQVGGSVGAGFPAWYGKTDAALSIDHERVVAAPHVSLALGLDAGIGLLYFDAPPETAASPNALIYWGPLVRARVQLHILDVLPNARAVGVVVGANAAVTSAHYLSTATGDGLRVEPELELGLTMRL